MKVSSVHKSQPGKGKAGRHDDVEDTVEAAAVTPAVGTPDPARRRARENGKRELKK